MRMTLLLVASSNFTAKSNRQRNNAEVDSAGAATVRVPYFSLRAQLPLGVEEVFFAQFKWVINIGAKVQDSLGWDRPFRLLCSNSERSVSVIWRVRPLWSAEFTMGVRNLPWECD